MNSKDRRLWKRAVKRDFAKMIHSDLIGMWEMLYPEFKKRITVHFFKDGLVAFVIPSFHLVSSFGRTYYSSEIRGLYNKKLLLKFNNVSFLKEEFPWDVLGYRLEYNFPQFSFSNSLSGANYVIIPGPFSVDKFSEDKDNYKIYKEIKDTETLIETSIEEILQDLKPEVTRDILYNIDLFI